MASTDDAVRYRLEDSRSTPAAQQLLGSYSGTVMCDGYSVYTSFAQKDGRFRLAHCWSHVRRKFLEIESSLEQEVAEVLKLIDELFEVEALCPTGPPGDEMRSSLRQSRSKPLVKEIERWALGTQTLAGSGLRGASSAWASSGRVSSSSSMTRR